MKRYVIEAVAKQPNMRRIKDTERTRYIKQPHGSDLWPADKAAAKLEELNAANVAACNDCGAVHAPGANTLCAN